MTALAKNLSCNVELPAKAGAVGALVSRRDQNASLQGIPFKDKELLNATECILKRLRLTGSLTTCDADAPYIARLERAYANAMGGQQV